MLASYPAWYARTTGVQYLCTVVGVAICIAIGGRDRLSFCEGHEASPHAGFFQKPARRRKVCVDFTSVVAGRAGRACGGTSPREDLEKAGLIEASSRQEETD
jgi:hypothetical protein